MRPVFPQQQTSLGSVDTCLVPQADIATHVVPDIAPSRARAGLPRLRLIRPSRFRARRRRQGKDTPRGVDIVLSAIERRDGCLKLAVGACSS
jgi:hypothetical protein